MGFDMGMDWTRIAMGAVGLALAGRFSPGNDGDAGEAEQVRLMKAIEEGEAGPLRVERSAAPGEAPVTKTRPCATARSPAN